MTTAACGEAVEEPMFCVAHEYLSSFLSSFSLYDMAEAVSLGMSMDCMMGLKLTGICITFVTVLSYMVCMLDCKRWRGYREK